MNEVKLIEEIVLKESDYGDPELAIYLKTPVMNFKFVYRQRLTNALAIHMSNEFLKSLNTGLEIKFESFKQYNALLKSIANKLNVPYSFPISRI
ncbi:hypothetical protein KQI42_15700 [Tissierella sp. MSJ-40]|uniref:Uncharacterized protein n=1 Tax=Tissierella simiarum TaxID=2841534 RepID=A0ABS6E9M2_9FIRM|nr:hypothetical protein [Tissierella simiarum]MBU5439459.1 hypothetical protein [Tissierella simiarum]